MSGLNERVKRQIALLAGDDLDPCQADETRRSVESCPHCRGHWSRVRGCLEAIERSGRTASAPADGSLWPSIESRLAPLRTSPRLERFNGWVPALSMAAACIALLIAGQMEMGPHQEGAVGGPTSAPVLLNPRFLSSAGMTLPRAEANRSATNPLDLGSPSRSEKGVYELRLLEPLQRSAELRN